MFKTSAHHAVSLMTAIASIFAAASGCAEQDLGGELGQDQEQVVIAGSKEGGSSTTVTVTALFGGATMPNAMAAATPAATAPPPFVRTNNGAQDRGPRTGAAGAGAPSAPNGDSDDATLQARMAVACFPGLSAAALKLCEQAMIRFQEVDSVTGSLAGEDGTGLGPTFNANGCAVCHSQPAVLGSSPAPFSPQVPVSNPQVALATHAGATNTVPSFITASGPIREARFVTDPATGNPDGGVHGLFTIAGRTDAPGCRATQPPFAQQVANNNVIFRIPTPTFGAGLIENIPEAALEANAAASANATLGINALLNRSGNDGTITRFGWKAQNKSLLTFAGEAYNVEQGISNASFPDEREGGAGNLTGCMAFNPTPEDNVSPAATGTVSDVHSDVMNFQFAMELSAPPTPAVPAGSTQAAVTLGQQIFTQVGCANCHTATFKTAASSFDPAMSNVTIHPYSDFGLHTMGTLADGVTQGGAAGNTFRTAPLWGLGQRMFFLHDGRTTDLVVAIQAHQSAGSGASVTVSNLANQSGANQQAVLDFLRSL
ncbi:MAG TPA: di-heme oxidoredictase family protein [Kofleriaceae bacterium]|jgi:CxxC motif-containing protein (DUF1111 family)|nr:di-heme oxidoredictase family protein [Kofleriaceae bacterium]